MHEQTAGSISVATGVRCRRSGAAATLLACLLVLGGLAGCGGEPARLTQQLDPVAAPDDVDALLRLADNLRNRGEFSTAIAIYQQAASKTDDPAVLIKLGRTLADAGAVERAAGVFRRAVLLVPDDPDALLGLGTSYLRLGDVEKSIRYLDQLVNQGDSPNVNHYAALGAAHELAGQHERALDAYRAGLKVQPANLDLKSNLALSYALNERHDEAIRIMRDVTESLEVQRAHHRNMVLILALAGREREAVAVGLRQLGAAETQDVLAQAASARGLTNSKDRARAIGFS